MIAMLCDSKGQTMCGTDTMLPLDGRFNRQNQLQSVRNYKETFKKHFPHKYAAWTHVYIVKNVNDKPGHLFHINNETVF